MAGLFGTRPMLLDTSGDTLGHVPTEASGPGPSHRGTRNEPLHKVI